MERNPVVTKKLIIGTSEWAISDHETDTVVEMVRVAMDNGSVVALPLLDENLRPVTVYFNGRLAQTAVLDLDGDPRPSEMT